MQTHAPTRSLIERANYWLIVAGIYLLSLVAFFPAMNGRFIWDDDYYVSNNAALKRGLDGLQWLWVGIYPNPYSYPVGIQYYPMTHITFWLQTRGHNWREELNPIPFHVINALLHATAAWALWTILRKLKVPGAMLAAGLFLVHPVQVESVAWITERKNVLSGMFLFLSMLVYLKFAKLVDEDVPVAPKPTNPRANKGVDFSLPTEPWKIYCLSLLLFILGILSKSVIGVMPVAIVLIVWWKRGTVRLKEDVVPLIPFFVLALAMGIWTGWFERNVIGAVGPEWDFSFADRLVIAGRAVWFYLSKLFVPVNQAFIYERWTIEAWQAVYGVLAVVVLAALVLARRRIGRGPLVLALLFVLGLFPALGFVNFLPQRYSFVADHFQYHACAAVFIGVAWLVSRWLKSAENAGLIILVPLMLLSMKQSTIYKDRVTLWTDTKEKTPSSWMAWNNLGTALFAEGKPDLADDAFEEALARKPDNAESIEGIANVAEAKGDLKAAFDLYEQAAAVYAQRRGFTGRRLANGSGPHYNMGRLLQIAGQRDAAIAQYEMAISLNDRHLFAILNLAELMRQKGDYERAISLGDQALALDPGSTGARMAIANALYDVAKQSKDQTKLQAALDLWRDVGEMDPKDPKVPVSIGRVLAEIYGQYDKAIPYFQRALKLDPENAAAKQNLALAIELAKIAATQPSATQPATTQTLTTQPVVP